MADISNNHIVLAVGDVAPCRAAPETMFDHVRAALGEGDCLFGQLETNITTRGTRAARDIAKLAMRAAPANADAIRAAGFDVMSFAGNHCLDWGEAGFRDTLDAMRERDIPICGAGATIEAARAPVFVEREGMTLAFLAYSSILPQGYWATQTRVGCAPMRAHTTFELIEPDQPGTPPRILTSPHVEDLEAMGEDIRRARAMADHVLVSMHWGIHITPVVIADYQKEVGRFAIDCGASAILGHHPHILKGVEFYRERPIIYSMGNFAIEQPQAFDADILDSPSFKHLISLHPETPTSDLYVLPDDTRMTMIVELSLSQDRIVRTAIRPCWIEDDSAPRLLSLDDPRFEQVRRYLEEISTQAGFDLRTQTLGDRVVLSPTNAT